MLKEKILERIEPRFSKFYNIIINKEKLNKMEENLLKYKDYVCLCSFKSLCPCEDLENMLVKNNCCKCNFIKLELK